MTILETMVEDIEGKYLSDAHLETTALFFLDALACIVGARTSPDAGPALRWAKSYGTAPGASAFVLGALSNVLELDSMHVRSGTHPGTVVVPAAIAIALRSRLGGRKFLAAILRASELTMRVGAVLDARHRSLFQPTSTCGAIGSAYASAALSGASASQRLNAIGNAASNAGGTWAFLDEGTSTKQWHAGRAAEAGVVASQLALEGFTGPKGVFENRRGFFAALGPDSDLSPLSQPRDAWALTEIAFKPWPSPRPTHAMITAALSARDKLGVGRLAEIDRIELKTFDAAVALCDNRNPKTEHEARFSLAFCAVAALFDGRIDKDSFAAAGRDRHAALVAKTRVSGDPAMTARYPQQSRASVTLHLKDRSTIAVAVDHALGDPELPLTVDQLSRKARDLFLQAGCKNANSIIDSVIVLPASDGDMATILAPLFAGLW